MFENDFLSILLSEHVAQWSDVLFISDLKGTKLHGNCIRWSKYTLEKPGEMSTRKLQKPCIYTEVQARISEKVI
jgi:hypothetical protein